MANKLQITWDGFLLEVIYESGEIHQGHTIVMNTLKAINNLFAHHDITGISLEKEGPEWRYRVLATASSWDALYNLENPDEVLISAANMQNWRESEIERIRRLRRLLQAWVANHGLVSFELTEAA